MKQSREQVQAVLSALKNGVVPQDISSFGIGREKELLELDNMLHVIDSGSGMVKFIGGEYGSGKSFLLKTFQQKALDRNFVVANLQMDKGLRLDDFQTIYYHIMHSLTIKESDHQGTSFKDLFNRWIRNLQSAQNKEESAAAIQHVISDLNQYNLSFSRALLYYLRARIQNDQELANAVASWLTGEKNIPYTLKKKFEIVGYIDKSSAIHFLQAFIRLIRGLGYSGLIILVDELELVMNDRSDIRQRAYENLRYLIDNSYNGHLNHSLFLFAATKDWFDHPEKGPQTYPPLTQRLGQWPETRLPTHPDLRRPIMVLSRPVPDELSGLTQKIIELYSYAYEFDLPVSQASLQKWVALFLREDGVAEKDINMRKYLMKLLEVLDLMIYNPNSRVFNAEIKAVSHGKKVQFIQTLG